MRSAHFPLGSGSPASPLAARLGQAPASVPPLLPGERGPRTGSGGPGVGPGWLGRAQARSCGPALSPAQAERRDHPGGRRPVRGAGSERCEHASGASSLPLCRLICDSAHVGSQEGAQKASRAFLGPKPHFLNAWAGVGPASQRRAPLRWDGRTRPGTRCRPGGGDRAPTPREPLPRAASPAACPVRFLQNFQATSSAASRPRGHGPRFPPGSWR